MNYQSTLDAYTRAISSGDRQAFLDCFSDTPALHHEDPAGSPPHRTREEIGGFWDNITGLFESVSLEFEECYPAGREVALKFRGRGRGKNGKAVEFPGIDVIQFDEHCKIVRLRAFWDAQQTLALLTS